MENENSVAFISRINKISSIKDAIKIELVTVNGWTSVTQKGIHKEGDLVLCITTDAVIQQSLAEMWGVYGYLRNNSRVRTVRLKGVYSECILIPICDISSNKTPDIYYEGRDLMSDLGIYKYEAPSKEIILPKIRKVYFQWKYIYKVQMWKSYFNYLYNVTKNKFKKYYKDNLNFEVYHKFPNQKNTPHMFNETDIVSITRKIHGANFRAGIVKKNFLTFKDRINIFLTRNRFIQYEFVYGSHRCEKGSDSQGFYSTDIWKEMVDKYDLKTKLWNLISVLEKDSIGKGVILYGEVFGEGVQGKEYSYGLDCRELQFFDIEVDGEYQSDYDFNSIIDRLDLPKVQLLYYGPWSKEIQDEFVGGMIPNTKTPHEGIVVKCVTGDRRKVSKVINNDYHTFSEKNNIEDLEAH